MHRTMHKNMQQRKDQVAAVVCVIYLEAGVSACNQSGLCGLESVEGVVH